jgi:hypothetical protein
MGDQQSKKEGAIDAPSFGSPIGLTEAPVRHMVQTTICRKASKKHGLTAKWDEVNCPECLQQAPWRRKPG